MTDDVAENWGTRIARAYPEMGAFARLLEEIGRESDRGVVLIMTGFLEQQLKELLAGYFVKTKSTSALLEAPFAPLSTLASRIHACHALGLALQLHFSRGSESMGHHDSEVMDGRGIDRGNA